MISVTSETTVLEIGTSKRPTRRRLSVKSLLKTSDNWRGWVVFQRPFAVAKGVEPLTVHADAAGPVKLVQHRDDDRATTQRIELFLDDPYHWQGDWAFDPEGAGLEEALRADLAESISNISRGANFDQWEPPQVSLLCGWLSDAGYEPVVDEKQGLRVTLKRPGLAGQVRVIRRPGCLRCTLPLGRWKDLPPAAESAMRRLAGDVNLRTRLARIMWRTGEDGATCCEAQVDLTGLPWNESPSSPLNRFWQAMFVKSAIGLEAAHQQLGIELGLLADPQHEDLVRFLS